MSETAGRDPAVQAIADRVGTVLNPKTPDPVVPAAPVAPAVPVAETVPPQDAGGSPERGPDGKFLKKSPELSPEARGLLAGLRAEREKNKELRREFEEYRNRPVAPVAPPVDRRADLLKSAPEETQKFWESVGDPVVRDTSREEAERLLAPYKPTLEAAAKIVAESRKKETFLTDLGEFVEDMALEGKAIDAVALVNTIERFEKQYDISLGGSNRKKFENAIGLFEAAPASRAPADTSADARKAAEAEAAAKARAGGVAPGSTATVPPSDTRTATQKSVRELAHKGDISSIADIIARRVPKHPLLGRPN